MGNVKTYSNNRGIKKTAQLICLGFHCQSLVEIPVVEIVITETNFEVNVAEVLVVDAPIVDVLVVGVLVVEVTGLTLLLLLSLIT